MSQKIKPLRKTCFFCRGPVTVLKFSRSRLHIVDLCGHITGGDK